MLSHPLGIVALVGRYPTNKLIPRKPLPRRNRTFGLQGTIPGDIIGYYPQFPAAIPVLGVRHLRLTTPFAARQHPEGPAAARLACLIHAANVHSEPGSNPSNDCFSQRRFRDVRRISRRKVVTGRCGWSNRTDQRIAQSRLTQSGPPTNLSKTKRGRASAKPRLPSAITDISIDSRTVNA